MDIKLKSTLYISISALFQSLFDLETAIEIRQVHKRFIKLPNAYNTIILARRALKFLGLNFLEGSRFFRFYFVPR